jgi:signal peptidase I
LGWSNNTGVARRVNASDTNAGIPYPRSTARLLARRRNPQRQLLRHQRRIPATGSSYHALPLARRCGSDFFAAEAKRVCRSEPPAIPMPSNKPHHFAKRFLRLTAVVFGVAGALFAGGLRLYGFPGISMVPDVNPGDFLVVLAGPWRSRPPQRFDRLIFDVPPTSHWAAQKIPWMKRLIGLPGEHLRLSGAELFINGQKIMAPCLHLVHESSRTAEIEITLGPDDYYVVGDNLDNTFDDSRSMGPIHRALIRGFAPFVIRTGHAPGAQKMTR